MIRGFVGRISSLSARSKSMRFFSDAPALGAQTQAPSDTGIQRYVNGELVKRSYLTLKKSEDIEA